MRFVEPREYIEWRDQQTTFENLSAFAMVNLNLSDGRAAERHAGAVISILYQVSIDYEFQTERLLTARLDLLDVSYPDGERRARFWERLGGELGGRTGIEQAAFTSLVPGAYGSGPQSYENVEKAYASGKDRPWCRVAVVSPGYFETMGVGLLEGPGSVGARRAAPGRRQGLRQIAVGVATGMLLAAALTRLLASQLVGVATLDPATFTTTAALLVGVGVSASLAPALRAAKVDPVRALRHE